MLKRLRLSVFDAVFDFEVRQVERGIPEHERGTGLPNRGPEAAMEACSRRTRPGALGRTARDFPRAHRRNFDVRQAQHVILGHERGAGLPNRGPEAAMGVHRGTILIDEDADAR